MTDHELREMVRASIARHMGHMVDEVGREPSDAVVRRHSHASFALLPLARGGDGDGACLIEPSVRCNHCGYCLSYGH
ncbi:MAG TPA: hypothetical protein VIW45_03140 [Vicinamibacterales bacterium]|jgi:hypothetical protein